MRLSKFQEMKARFPHLSSHLMQRFIGGWLGGFLAMNFFHAVLPYTNWRFGLHTIFIVWLVASSLFAVNIGLLAVVMDEQSVRDADFQTIKSRLLVGLLFSIGAWASYHISLKIFYFNDLNSLLWDIPWMVVIWLIGGFGMWIGVFINYRSNKSSFFRITITALPLFFVIYLLEPALDMGAWSANAGLLDWRDMSELIPLTFALIVATGLNFPLDLWKYRGTNRLKKKK